MKPKLSDVEKDKISTFYSEIRKYSNAVGGIPIGVRHIESMLRMSEAHAKMHLREYVRADDVNLAIRMLLESFMQSQKQSVASSLRPKFAKYLSRYEDDNQLILHTLRNIVKEKIRLEKTNQSIPADETITVTIKKTEFLLRAKEVFPGAIDKFFSSNKFQQMKEFSYDGDKIEATGK